MLRLLLCLFFAADIQALDSPSYLTRQEAEARLRSWGWVALPAVRPLCSSPRLEVRRRAHRVVKAALLHSLPPVSFLAGRPEVEWVMPSPDGMKVKMYAWPGPGWTPMWYRNPPNGSPLRLVVLYYARRARTQADWEDWHLDTDARVGTRMLVDDLTVLVGIPPPAVEFFILEPMRRVERSLTTTPTSAIRR